MPKVCLRMFGFEGPDMRSRFFFFILMIFRYRQTFEKFLNRYKMLTKDTWPKYKGDPKEGCKIILTFLQGNTEKNTSKSPFQFGKTKIFVRNPDWVLWFCIFDSSTKIYSLEELRLRALHEVVKRLQAVWRAYQIRKYYLELRAASLGIFEGRLIWFLAESI